MISAVLCKSRVLCYVSKLRDGQSRHLVLWRSPRCSRTADRSCLFILVVGVMKNRNLLPKEVSPKTVCLGVLLRDIGSLFCGYGILRSSDGFQIIPRNFLRLQKLFRLKLWSAGNTVPRKHERIWSFLNENQTIIKKRKGISGKKCIGRHQFAPSDHHVVKTPITSELSWCSWGKSVYGAALMKDFYLDHQNIVDHKKTQLAGASQWALFCHRFLVLRIFI